MKLFEGFPGGSNKFKRLVGCPMLKKVWQEAVLWVLQAVLQA
jgi:hypothetical protein